MAKDLKVNEIVRTYRNELGSAMGKPVKQEEFGEILIKGLFNDAVTRQTVGNWESGRTEPELEFLIALYTYHFGKDTWQLRFAAECLKAMHPETFKSGIIELKLPGGTNHNGNK